MAEELRELRLSKQIPAKDMVAVVQAIYPKYDKTVQSKCENGDAYGVSLRPDPMAEFMLTLRREPTPTTEAMQNGIDFEDLVTSIINGRGDPNNQWYAAAEKVARRCAGGILQYKAKKVVEVGGVSLLLYGRLDCLKAGEIIDVKFTKSYDAGKYFGSTQHPTYFELIPEARQFTYIASNGRDVWPETYFREDAPSIFPVISDFFDWLRAVDLMQVYQEKWAAL